MATVIYMALSHHIGQMCFLPWAWGHLRSLREPCSKVQNAKTQVFEIWRKTSNGFPRLMIFHSCINGVESNLSQWRNEITTQEPKIEFESFEPPSATQVVERISLSSGKKILSLKWHQDFAAQMARIFLLLNGTNEVQFFKRRINSISEIAPKFSLYSKIQSNIQSH